MRFLELQSDGRWKFPIMSSYEGLLRSRVVTVIVGSFEDDGVRHTCSECEAALLEGVGGCPLAGWPTPDKLYTDMVRTLNFKPGLVTKMEFVLCGELSRQCIHIHGGATGSKANGSGLHGFQA
jgi:hypothetical protein